jgi:molecular chaperone HscB
MDYFTLFDIPVSLKVDKSLARKKYFELSKKYHPDYFVNNSQEMQQDALESSALLNKALKTFSNPDETIRYVLMMKGLLVEEEKYQLSPEFLMEMLEINEELAESAFDGGDSKESIRQKLVDLEKELYEPVQNIVENYKEGITTEEELLQVKDYYFRKKYLQRLYEQLDGMQ